MKISQHDHSISRAEYEPVSSGTYDSLHFCRIGKTPPPHLSLECIQDASPSSASKLAFSSVSGPKTRKPSSPRSSNRFPARLLWSGLLPVLLLLALLFGLAAPNESHAQITSCSASDVTDATTEATNAFNWHATNPSGTLANATVFYRTLIALNATLPAWTGSNISGNAPTTAISAADVRTFSAGDTWSGWTTILTALDCLENLPVITISGGSAVTEGTGAPFTVNASPAPSSNLTVNLNVSDAAGSDFVALINEGSQTVEITASQTSATHTVPTVDDTSNEADGDVTVTVVVGAGARVYRVGSPSSATVTVNDDDPGITLSTAGPLRLLETGSTSYTVVLDAVPTADVEVRFTTVSAGIRDVHADVNAVDTNIPDLTFTTTNWSEPQTVTLNGMDESGTHRNRGLQISHAAFSADSRYSSLSSKLLRVNVDDAPEVEAWPDYDRANGSVPFLRRPNTVVSSNGLTPKRNMYPGYELTYVLRLSNRPEPGGTVTVTATVPSDKQNLIGLSLTGPSDPLDGPDYRTWATNLPGTLDVTFNDGSPAAGTGCSNWHGGSEFEYHDDNGRFHTVTGGGRSETWDSTADTPWKCWRKVWVVRKPASRNIANTCADITHTASGGGVRQVTVDTVRVHIFNADFTRARDCPKLTENTPSTPQPAAAEAAPVTPPTEAVSNLQVTEVDATSVSVTWDAVAHATSYDVSWSAESSDSLNASAGAEGVTGTTATIQHDASVPMTLTVTVTPEYIDENGVTQQLDALAGTATLAVGPSGQRLESGGGTNSDNGGSIDSGEGAVDLPVPVSHWRFEYDAIDWVGSSHGTEKGGVTFEANEEGEGVDDHALSLDGSDDYVDLSTHVSDFPLGDSTRSVTGWFKADAGNQGQSFFSYGSNVAGKRFSIAADRTQVLVAVSGHAWGVNGLELQDGWHHVAVTYAGGDSDDISVYLDGELQSASTLVGSPKRLNTGTGPAAIGRNVGGTKHYTGLIDDVRLYDVALSAEHVLALFEEHPQTVLVEGNQDTCVSDKLAADVDGYSKETWQGQAHVERWLRVLETFSGTANDSRVMTPTEAEGYVNRGWRRWEPVLEALECME